MFENFDILAWISSVGAVLCIALIPVLWHMSGRNAKRGLAMLRTSFHGGPLDLSEFNRLFVSANKELAKGNTEGLKNGIGLLIQALEVAGDYAQELCPAIRDLRCALSHHDRADTKGPWNRDLSGYGLWAWKNDLWDRESALQQAWPHIEAINKDLVSKGLGWNY